MLNIGIGLEEFLAGDRNMISLLLNKAYEADTKVTFKDIESYKVISLTDELVTIEILFSGNGVRKTFNFKRIDMVDDSCDLYYFIDNIINVGQLGVDMVIDKEKLEEFNGLSDLTDQQAVDIALMQSLNMLLNFTGADPTRVRLPSLIMGDFEYVRGAENSEESEDELNKAMNRMYNLVNTQQDTILDGSFKVSDYLVLDAANKIVTIKSKSIFVRDQIIDLDNPLYWLVRYDKDGVAFDGIDGFYLKQFDTSVK